jgi:hypothetical protein
VSPSTLSAGGQNYEIFRLEGAERLPYTLRILLENALRHGEEEDAEALRRWQPASAPSDEISFRPARVLLQDFTGVPAVVDLAGMRNAMADLGGDPSRINPQLPAELVIDHSVQVDEYGSARAMFRNAELEFERNRERYAFLRWGQTAFDNFKVVPPNTGIVHQVNLEFLARVIEARDGQAFPDTLVGTDSHTTMINGLGVLGWGVGGIEAEAAMLGEAVSMLIPEVVGFKLIGSMPEGATATDLVLTVTQLLRAAGVVGKFVEYFGHGLVGLPLADRATIGNMSPEYGATCGFFPVDDETQSWGNTLAVVGRLKHKPFLLVSGQRAVYAIWALMTLASGILVYSLMTGDFRYSYVAQYSNWAMPLVVDYAGSKQVIVAATNKVRSYDLKTGKVIWECAGLGRNVIPALVRQDDVVFAMSGNQNPNLMAIRLGRTGDLTGSDSVLWTNARGASYTPSPVIHEGKLYVLTDNGMLSCYNALTGAPYYRMVRLPRPYSFKSSLAASAPPRPAARRSCRSYSAFHAASACFTRGSATSERSCSSSGSAFRS